MGKLTPEDILDTGTGQIRRREEIHTMLINAGFEKARQTGTTHSHYIHRSSSITVGGHNSPKSKGYQKDAAKAVLAVREWEEKQDNRKEEQLKRQFSLHARQDDENTKTAQEQLKDKGVIVTPSKRIPDMCIVRDAEFPQVGAVCPIKIDDGNKKSVLSQIQSAKSELLLYLKTLEEEFDYKLIKKDDDQTLHLQHEVYGEDFNLALRPWDPFDTDDALNKLLDIQGSIEDIDVFLRPHINKFVNEATKSQIRPEMAEDGKLKWDIPVTHFLTHGKTHIPLETTTNHRASPEEMQNFMEQLFRFQRNYSELKNHLSEDLLGVKVSKKKGRRGKAPQLVVRLPGKEAASFELDVIPRSRLSSSQDLLDVAEEISDTLEHWTDEQEFAQLNISTITEQRDQAREKLKDLYYKLGSQGTIDADARNTTLSRIKPGDIAPIFISNHSVNVPPVGIRFIYAAQHKGHPIGNVLASYPFPTDVKKLEQSMKDAGLINDDEKPEEGDTPSAEL